MSVTTRTVRSGTGPVIWVCALVAAGCGGGGSSGDGGPPAQPPSQGNRPPTISGIPPATVSAGAAYDFRPDAVEDPRARGYTVGGLEPATWYFAVTAYSAAGVESDRSQTVSEAIAAD